MMADILSTPPSSRGIHDAPYSGCVALLHDSSRPQFLRVWRAPHLRVGVLGKASVENSIGHLHNRNTLMSARQWRNCLEDFKACYPNLVAELVRMPLVDGLRSEKEGLHLNETS